MGMNVVAKIRQATRRKYTAEEKIRIVLEGLRERSRYRSCAAGTGNDRLPGHRSSKSLEFVGDAIRIFTLRYGWTDHGGQVKENGLHSTAA